MSHFVVAVITEQPTDLESILQPFHEFECTGINDQYVQDVDVTEECEDVDDLGDYGLEDRIVSDESEVDRNEKHKHGYAIVKDGKLVKAVHRTNPNKKWDWWTLGGRWKGSLLTKGGRKVDQARKADTDFATMRADAEANAAAEYDAAIKIIDGRAIPKWETFREVLFPGNIEEARKAYHDDPVMLDWKKAYPENFFGPSPKDYEVPRETFIEAAGDNSFGAFAVLDANGWHEKGSMGWWGIVSDEQADSLWARQVQEFLASVPDDHYISMVDCHI